MKILALWSNISGYMASCWRSLAAREGVELKIVAFRPAAESLARFDPLELVADLQHELIDQKPADPAQAAVRLGALTADFGPDAVLTAGWVHRPYCDLLLSRAHTDVPVVMGLDLPWRGTLRQRAAPWVLRRWLKRVDRAFVPGERAWQYARRLGFAEEAISRGLYGVDASRFQEVFEAREAREDGWPRQFVFAGRYIDIKGVPDLLNAYATYRKMVDDPWPLVCCGSGPHGAALGEAEGVSDLGFLQPSALAGVLADSGVYVMPSRFDPWPLAVVEACAAGLPVIATEACGSTVENVRPEFNGWLCPTGNPLRLAEAMGDAHRRHNDLPDLGRNSFSMARAYSNERWADRTLQITRSLRDGTGGGVNDEGNTR